jgi:hypothetical protein
MTGHALARGISNLSRVPKEDTLMKRMLTTAALAMAAAGAMGMVPSQAQAQASITATATVATALTVTAGNDLDLQLVIPGFTKTVAVSDATAGTFALSGGAGAEVSLSFTSLPANLDDGLGHLLPIAYSAVHNTVNDPVAGATAFAPASGSTTNLSGLGALFVFLGGTVNATAQFNPGTYTGTVTLTAAYTGN